MHINFGIELDYEAIINIFAQKHLHRMVRIRGHFAGLMYFYY